MATVRAAITGENGWILPVGGVHAKLATESFGNGSLGESNSRGLGLPVTAPNKRQSEVIYGRAYVDVIAWALREAGALRETSVACGRAAGHRRSQARCQGAGASCVLSQGQLYPVRKPS